MQVKLLMIINSGTRSTPAHMLQGNLTLTKITMKCLLIRALSSKSCSQNDNETLMQQMEYQLRGVQYGMEYGQNFNKNLN